jgi:hypothetical protein
LLFSHPASLAQLNLHTLELNCIVQGDEPTHAFLVKILNTKNVGALKKAIKEEKTHAFEQVDADTLNLWKVGALPVLVCSWLTWTRSAAKFPKIKSTNSTLGKVWTALRD